MINKPIGLRNNNPGNIRVNSDKFLGEVPSDNGFKKFVSRVHGYRAIFVVLNTYNKRYGLSTIREIINRYAPSSENNTNAYIDYVASATCISPDAKLDFSMKMPIVSIVYAMAYIETGYKPDAHEVIDGYRLSPLCRS